MKPAAFSPLISIKTAWADDARAFLETCATFQIPAILERSQEVMADMSGYFSNSSCTSCSGSECWHFAADQYDEPATGNWHQFLRSSVFPARFRPKGGFGNLIALPLQKKPREQENSVFIKYDLIPYPDQSPLLSSVSEDSSTGTGSLRFA